MGNAKHHRALDKVAKRNLRPRQEFRTEVSRPRVKPHSGATCLRKPRLPTESTGSTHFKRTMLR